MSILEGAPKDHSCAYSTMQQLSPAVHKLVIDIGDWTTKEHIKLVIKTLNSPLNSRFVVQDMTNISSVCHNESTEHIGQNIRSTKNSTSKEKGITNS